MTRSNKFILDRVYLQWYNISEEGGTMMKEYTVKAVTVDGKVLYGDPTTKEKAEARIKEYSKHLDRESNETKIFKSLTLMYREVNPWKEV